MGRRVRLVRGPLAPWATGFGRWLTVRGYASRSAYQRVCPLSLLSCWLEREGLGAGALADERAARFLDARLRLVAARGCCRGCDVSEFVIDRPTLSTTR
jgi:hypothetical protein